jgi:hypothetical protein
MLFSSLCIVCKMDFKTLHIFKRCITVQHFNILLINLKEIDYMEDRVVDGRVVLIDWVQWWALVNTVMILRVTYRRGIY